jgi:hypothetical protein
MKKWTEYLPCQLNSDEVLERASQLSQVLATRKEAEDARKATAKRLKSIVDAHDAEASQLAEAIRDRAERRSVECTERFDLRVNKASVIRCDTGEVISVRTMTSEEIETHSQATLFEVSMLTEGEPERDGEIIDCEVAGDDGK